MRRLLAVAVCIAGIAFRCGAAQQQVLIVADEFHAMQVLASQLEADTHVVTRIVGQTELPPSLATYKAVLVYIHGDLRPAAEQKFIDYAKGGGDLVLLHHTISSGKRENKDWFTFLQIELPKKALADGGYTYFDPVSYQVVNLAPGNPITTRAVAFDSKFAFGQKGNLPGTTFTETEVYLHHVLQGERTVLLGLVYTDAKTGTVYQQPTAGWMLPTGKGEVFYFQMGHRAEDFQNAAYRHMLDNAVEFSK